KISDKLHRYLETRGVRTLQELRYWRKPELLESEPNAALDETQPDEDTSHELEMYVIENGGLWFEDYEPTLEGDRTIKIQIKKGQEKYAKSLEDAGKDPQAPLDREKEMKITRKLNEMYRGKEALLLTKVDQVPGAKHLKWMELCGCDFVGDIVLKTEEEHLANGAKKGWMPKVKHELYVNGLEMGAYARAKQAVETPASKDLAETTQKRDALRQQFGFDLKMV